MDNIFKKLAQKVVELAGGLDHKIVDFVHASEDALRAKIRWEFKQEAARLAVEVMIGERPEKRERLRQAIEIINED